MEDSGNRAARQDQSPPDGASTKRIALSPGAARAVRAAARGNILPGETDERAWRAHRFTRNTPFYQLLESVYDAVAITDLDGHILEANARAAQFFRRDVSSLYGIPVTSLISGADESLLDSIRANLRSKKFTLVEARAKRSDGTTFPSEIAVNSVSLDSKGELSFFFRDVTIRSEAQRKLQDAVKRLEAQDRARLEFVSNCSHELRTPLTSMIYAVENLLRGIAGPLPEKALEYLDRLRADSKRLLGTVNDILDLRQIETHTLAVMKAVSPLSEVVRDGVEPAAVQAAVKKIDISLSLPGTELFSECDAKKISRVVLNIAGNAVKFTPAAGKINVSLQRDGDFALVRIDDTGVGVEPENLHKLSRRYFHSGDEKGGSGLGLAISREIVELHNGSISFDSPVPGTDCGTRVSFRLPLCKPPVALVAGYEPGCSAELSVDISSLGWKSSIAPSLEGPSLVSACKSTKAAVLAMIPDPANLEAIRDSVIAVRSDIATKFLPIIMFTAKRLPRADVEMARAFNLLVVRLPWKKEDIGGFLSKGVLGTIK